MAIIVGVPAALIMRVTKEDIEVFVASKDPKNPYHPGDREHFRNSGLYCETVINTKHPLLVPDALSDPNWKGNPDVKHKMISYLGFPILFPDDTPFGTLCILDGKPNGYSDTIYNLLEKYRDLLQSHLALLYLNTELGESNRSLLDYLHEIQSLRGLIPICCRCKKIKDSQGHWQSVEKYLTNHPEANFTHGYCPECHREVLKELEKSHS